MMRWLLKVWGLLFLAAFLGVQASAQTPSSPGARSPRQPTQAPTATILLTNGHVYTVDPDRPWATAIAIQGDRILGVGSDREVAKYRGRGTRVIDLGGRMVMPGIIDSHIHFLEGSLSLDHVSLDGLYTVAEIQQRVKAFAAAHPDRPWVVGHGWVYEAFKPSGLPDKKMLDDIIPTRPVALWCYDGHSIWVNSRGLALAGITKSTPDIKQAGIVTGTIVRDPETGEPTGVLKEEATSLVEHVIPEPTHDQKLQALRAGLQEANRHGLTSVVNASGSPEEIALYAELLKKRQLTLRTYTALTMEPQLTKKTLDTYEAVRRRYHDAWVRAGMIKAFMDGVVESHTAAMLYPYSDDSKTMGSLNYSADQFRKNVVELDRRKFQIMTHAIGDRAIRTTLDAYAAAEDENGKRDRRFRIEHLETINLDDVPRFKTLDVIASMQPYHCYPDPNLLNVWASAIGPERLPNSFAWKDLASDAPALAFGSDWPVVSLDPFIGIQNAVTRQDASGQPPYGWVGGEKVSLEQALASYTLFGAYAEFEDKIKGSLEPRKLADLIVLSQDLFKISPLQIGKTKVQMTIVGGKIVYREGL